MSVSNFRQTLLYKVFESNYCKIVFALGLVISYLLIPKAVFESQYLYLAIIYMTLFSTILTCVIRTIKERIKQARMYEKSLIGIIASGIGLATLQVCTLSMSCSVSLGLSILYLIFPQFFISFLTKYSQYILVISIIFQAIAIYLMGCFKTVFSQQKNKKRSIKTVI